MQGGIYAYVSKWFSGECSNGKIPFVPHIIELPAQGKSQKTAFGIPESVFVFGFYGGSDSFNLDYVKKVIAELVDKNLQIYFWFMNVDHPQVIFLPGNSDPVFKSSFINTCDAMIHARGIGKGFDLACGEFSMHNKPAIAYAPPQRNHIDVLKSKAILYKDPKDLSEIFLNFHKASSQKTKLGLSFRGIFTLRSNEKISISVLG